MKKNLFYLAALCLTVLACSTQMAKLLTAEDYKKLSEDDRRKVENARTGVDIPDAELDATLFASEPMISNPTNMDIDAKGRVWVCEADNYRPALNPTNPYDKKGDRIMILEDTNGDGKADKSKVFYQGEDVNAALGISVLGNKIYVSCNPNLFVFTDENGDDIPDKKEVILRGSGSNQHDHAMHAVSFGPDGKLYFNSGNETFIKQKGDITIKDDLGRPLDNTGNPYREGMVYRCDMDGSNFEILGWNFRNNYEVAVDAFGRMWQSDNDDDGNKGVRINNVVDYGNYGFKDEMTGASWQERRTNWEDEIPKRHWHLNDPGVVPNMLQTGAGSPCGMVVYEGTLLPKKYQNQVIHADAGPNIVRAYPVEKDGAGFKATIANIMDGAQRDNWFRPCDVTVAPDGSLFVADWYDPGVGGHAAGDLGRGRIYRIAPKAVANIYKNPTFDFATANGCVEALKNPNLAVRHIAWMKLHAMGRDAEAPLVAMFEKSDNPRLRARAMWLLGLMPDMDNNTKKSNGRKHIYAASMDKDEDVRCAALRMARQQKVDILYFSNAAVNDPSMQVKREALINLRHNREPQAAEIWAKLAMQYDGKDRWYLETLGIAADDNWDKFLGVWLGMVGNNWIDGKNKDIVWRSRATKTAEMLTQLIKVSEGKEQLRYFRALDFQKVNNKTELLLSTLDKKATGDLSLLVFKHIDPKTAISNAAFTTFLPKVLEACKQPSDLFDIVKRFNLKSETDRLMDYVLKSNNWDLQSEAAHIVFKNEGTAPLDKILRGSNENEKLASIAAFGSVDAPETNAVFKKILLDAEQNMAIREKATQALFGWNGQDITWDLVQKNQFPKELIEVVKPNLMNSWHNEIRPAAVKHFMGEVNTDYGNINDLAKMKGNAIKGIKTFETYCLTCHKMAGKGTDFGPGLSEIGSKLSKSGLFSSIINPSQGISFGYEGHVLTMKDGSENQGMLLSKTENEIVMKELGVTEPKRYKRTEIASQKMLEESLMPKFPMKKEELVDLVEYLAGLKKVK
jgi:putative membrane-bound dehydrogenase-like protein